MTEKITTIYRNTNHVRPKLRMNVSVMRHYKNLYSSQGHCICVEQKPYSQQLWWLRLIISSGTQWDFYSHQQQIKLQQVVNNNDQYYPAMNEHAMSTECRHNK